jgi:hypothetical protein
MRMLPSMLLLIGALLFAFHAAVCEEPPSGEQQDPTSTCKFCRVEQPFTAYLCTHCGRLFRIESLESSNRFWGDAFYIYGLPTITSRADIVAEIGPEGLLRETASFGHGDRYEYSLTAKGPRVSGRVRGPTSKEAAYNATIVDSQDESGRLITRAVHGQLNTKPKRFLYRLIDYRYEGGRVQAAEVGSWVYAKANDWEKHPGEWIRHSKVDIRFEYLDAVLVRIHSQRRKGVRDLRGSADYVAAESFTESVEVEAGVVIGFGPPVPSHKEP